MSRTPSPGRPPATVVPLSSPAAPAAALLSALALSAASVLAALGSVDPNDRRVDDVEARFERIPTHGAPIRARSNGRIPPPWYTASLKNRLGFRNHFQSVVRVPNSNYLVLSGGNQGEPMSRLFVVHLASREGQSPLGFLAPYGGPPPPEDRIVSTVPLDSGMWHAGGLSLVNGVLAVPIYGGNPLHGKVLFFDLTDPERPEQLAVDIDRPGRKAYAVAMTRLPDGRHLVAVLSDRDGLPRRMDFYRSRSSDLARGFDPNPVTWRAEQVKATNGQDANFGDFQNLNFITQTDDQLFLIGLHNTAPSIDPLPGRDYADLYRVELAGSVTPADGSADAPVITKIANKHLRCEDGGCNLDAGGSVYIDDSEALIVYATAYWLDHGILKMTEFSAAAPLPGR